MLTLARRATIRQISTIFSVAEAIVAAILVWRITDITPGIPAALALYALIAVLSDLLAATCGGHIDAPVTPRAYTFFRVNMILMFFSGVGAMFSLAFGVDSNAWTAISLALACGAIWPVYRLAIRRISITNLSI